MIILYNYVINLMSNNKGKKKLSKVSKKTEIKKKS